MARLFVFLGGAGAGFAWLVRFPLMVGPARVRLVPGPRGSRPLFADGSTSAYADAAPHSGGVLVVLGRPPDAPEGAFSFTGQEPCGLPLCPWAREGILLPRGFAPGAVPSWPRTRL